VPDWSPDAVIPASGLPAWSEPDGSAPPATQLQAGVEVRIAERKGDWAHVECWNGWSGWLNGRLLVRRWTATHVPPPGGLDAWTSPDPTSPPSSRFGDGEELTLIEQQPSGWAHVETASGAKAWVDGRRLLPRGAAPPPRPPAPPPGPPPPGAGPQPGYAAPYQQGVPGPGAGGKQRVEAPFGITMPEWWPAEIPVVAAAGAVLVLFGSILPWWTYGFSSSSAWNIPLFALISGANPPLSGLKVGLPLLAVLVVGLPALTKKHLPENVLAIIGVGVVALSVLTLLRGLIGYSSGGFFGGSGRISISPGFGLFVSLVGGVLMGLDWFRMMIARARHQQAR
jgi:hypothetical protein